MSEFSALFLELRMHVDDPEVFRSSFSAHLDPNLVDQLSGYAAARGFALPNAVMKALELFMVSAAEDSWREISGDGLSQDASRAMALNIVLERFLTAGLDGSRQRLIEGSVSDSVVTHFQRMPDD